MEPQPAIKQYSHDMQNYDYYGRDSTIDITQADPVQCVIDGPHGINKLFVCPRATRLPIGFARAFMAQRCAKNWDGYCDMYTKQEQDADFTGKHFHEFIKNTLAQMFCQNDTSVPGNQCYQTCQQFDPTSNGSYSVCSDAGDMVFRSSNKVQAIDTDFPQSGKLNIAEPIKITQCPKVCNMFNQKNLSNDNIALNYALDAGIAMDLITNLIDNIVSAGKQGIVTNDRLKKLMGSYVMDGSVKPGFSTIGYGPLRTTQFSATPAVDEVIVPGQMYLVDPGYQHPLVTDYPQHAPQPVQQPYPSSEGFGYVALTDASDDKAKKIMRTVAIVALIVLVLFIIYKLIKSHQKI